MILCAIMKLAFNYYYEVAVLTSLNKLTLDVSTVYKSRFLLGMI